MGDPYQSIYGFAGTDSQSFNRVMTTFHCQRLALTDCFRCPTKAIDIAKDFGLEGKYEENVKSLMTLQALATIRELDLEQKEMVAKMMGKMIVIDNDINYNEVKLYNAFCESCNIEKDFNVDEYEDVTLSGPFVNPEDLMNI